MAGDPIPGKAQWSNSGRTYKGGDGAGGCYDVNGGQMFYAYDYPDNYVPSLRPPISSRSNPHFPFYEVVSVITRVIPYVHMP